MLKDRSNKAEFDFTTTSADGSGSSGDSEGGEGLQVGVDKKELLNVVVTSAIGGIASAWAVKSTMGDD